MARYLRVRATKPTGAHRAGMFFGPKKAEVLDKASLSPDQIDLLKREDGGLLIVDEVDDPNAAPTAGGPGAEVFDAHPGVAEQIAEVKRQVEDAFTAAELSAGAAEDERQARVAAEAERDAAQAQVDELQKQLADTQGERDAAKASVADAKADAERAIADAQAARQEAEDAKADPKPKGGKRQPKTDPAGDGATE